MANTYVQFRMDETSRAKAVQICEGLGIDLPTYLRMCVARLVKENGVPFSMSLNDVPTPRGLSAMKRASKIAKEYGIADMTLDEINAEISAARGSV